MEDRSRIEIGEPTKSDILVCVQIENIDSEQIRQQVAEELEASREQGLVRVARLDAEVVGYLDYERTCLGASFTASIGLPSGRKDTWYLSQITISPHHRRKGIASLLIGNLIDYATALPNPPKRILSMIQPENLPSLNMHAKHGFLTSGTLYLRENDLRILLLKQLPIQENK